MDEEICCVIPNLYMGSVYPTLDEELLLKFNIKHILSLGTPIPKFEGINYQQLSIFDFPEFDILPHFERAFAFINSAMELDENVYVHCFGGVSRSATIIIGYLMKQNSWTYTESYQYLKNLRPCIKPNVGFVRQLLYFENELITSHEDP